MKDKIKVLMAEDTPVFREIFAYHFEHMPDFEVTFVHNGQEAVDALSNAPRGSFDLILSDVEMPKKCGLTFLEDIHNLEELAHQKHLPFGFVSGTPELVISRFGKSVPVLKKPALLADFIDFATYVMQQEGARPSFPRKTPSLPGEEPGCPPDSVDLGQATVG
jgi:CheY-like chemotaxis protein